MRLGNLGIQYAIKSEKAFDRLVFDNYSVAGSTKYYPQKKQREETASEEFRNIRSENSISEEIFMIDLIRRG